MRNKRLDVLRCVAVVLVILCHSDISYFFVRVGWVGVDLFFVLSGFLISGLLFSEYKKRHCLSFKRFAIRRALKIYPAFYMFLFLTWIVSYAVWNNAAPLTDYLHEMFFVMNYERGVWDHTWSLAVEEHFYIFLPIFLLLLVRLSPDRDDPFRIIPWVSLTIGALCIVFRAISVDVGTPNFLMAYTGSHCRMDALFFGVLLGYLYHFRPSTLVNLMRPTANRWAIALMSTVLISFSWLPPRENRFQATLGFTLLYLGFGGLLLLSLYVYGVLPKRIGWMAAQVGNAFAYAGVYSYSIYLWHGPVGAWFPGLLRRVFGFPTSKSGVFAAYFIASFAIGIVMSRLIEYPILRLRDRLFPQMQVMAVATDVDAAVAPNVVPS